MRVSFISIFPEMILQHLEYGVIGRAVNQGALDLKIYNPRDYANNANRNVDDKPFGGGPGMVMMAEPLIRSVAAAREESSFCGPVILMSPQGRQFDHKMASELSKLDEIILVSGRYEGVDQRFIDKEVDLEISIGDFVLSGGELAALVIMDVVARLTTGVLGNPESINFDSYVDGLLEFPQYTRPQELNVGDGKQNDNHRSIPRVLLSGDHDRINEWRKQKALERTWEKRPDLLAGRSFSSEERKLLKDFIETGQTP